MNRDGGYLELKHMEAMINLKCVIWKWLSMKLFQAAAQLLLWSAPGWPRGSREQALCGSQVLYVRYVRSNPVSVQADVMLTRE